MKTPIILIISDIKSAERRENMAIQMSKFKLKHIYIDAIFPTEFSKINVDTLPATARKIKGVREYGCSLSHLSAYKYIIENNIDGAVILEDDAEISSDFAETIRHISSKKFDIILLGLSKLTKNEYKYYQHYTPIHTSRSLGKKAIGRRAFGKRFGAVAYAISREAAKKLIAANNPTHVVADNWNYFESHHGIIVEEIRPLIAYECWDKFGSSIDIDRGGRQLNILYSRDRDRSTAYTLLRSINGYIHFLLIRIGVIKSDIQ